MNKNAIKKFAIDARNKLIASVTDKAGMLGISANGINNPITKGRDFEVYKTSAGTEVTLDRKQCWQRSRLVDQIESRGFEAVIEEVAYTWFNRICAIRFMEVNDYLPVHVLSSIKDGKTEPDIVTNAPDVDIDFTDAEKSFILEAKVGNKLDELFRMLFIKQCHELNDILPELFEKTEDYTEMLLNISYTNEDDVIRMLVDTVDEKDFNVTTLGDDGKPTGQVEIIGWLYQYYNTELKDDTFAKLKNNVKITKERIPAVTQLFTPDWIVRYMVENSVGRIWIEHLRAVDPSVDEKVTAENFGWKYYLQEAEQEDSVNVKLAEIRTSYANLKPEDITCIDPCMGSGHILIAMFDVLMDIYKSTGYSEKEAAFSIVENNIHGLDIDKRAYQLAYFAVMMKGRGYNRRFFRGHDDMKPQPKVYAIQESNEINRAHIKYFGAGLSAIEKNNALNQINGLLDVMTDAREYGSILNVDNYDWDLLSRFADKSGEDNQLTLETIGIDVTRDMLIALIKIGKTMATKYWVCSTNPPYMAVANANAKLQKLVKDRFPDTKNDLFAVFIEKTRDYIKHDGYQSLITQQAWMFHSTYEELRRKCLSDRFISIIQLGARAFDEIKGEVVQTCAFIKTLKHVDNYNSSCCNLTSSNSENGKREEYLQKNSVFHVSTDRFKNIDGLPFSYWASEQLLLAFEKATPMMQIGDSRSGLQTGNNELFLRLWFEVSKDKLAIGISSSEEMVEKRLKWVPQPKGGSYRKWYGNLDYVVNYEDDGRDLRNFDGTSIIKNPQYYFLEGVTWSHTSTQSFAARYMPKGCIFNVEAPTLYPNNNKMLMYYLAAMNTKIIDMLFGCISQSMHYLAGDMQRIPIYVEKDQQKVETIIKMAEENVAISKADWDSTEYSWDFKKHPFLEDVSLTIEEAFNRWNTVCQERFSKLKNNEEELNRLFIELYGLTGEVLPQINEDDITVRKANAQVAVKALISYAIGCMFGRYSAAENGLIYAGGEWEINRYTGYLPDVDNIIPITDEEYFEDDIVGLFVKWLKEVFGENNLDKNLNYISDVLDNKGKSAREVLRNYFLNDFYKDHCNTYSVTGSGKRPIYWLFDSGKANGFKCLIYVHRYNPDIVGRIRTEYLHRAQAAIEQAMYTSERIRDNSNSGSEKSSATKRIAKYTKQLAEIKQYDEAMAHVANQRIAIDLDDGVKANYAKFQGVEVAQEGKKSLKIDLLAALK